jgi:hypothetical protein
MNRIMMAALVLMVMAGTSGNIVGEQKRARTSECADGLESFLRTSLYTDRSNRNSPKGRLSDDEWQKFVDDVLVRHFPAGGTVYSNAGWWRRPNGTIGGGPGHTIVVLAPLEHIEAHRHAVKAVIREIKTRHGHLSVGREEDRVCAAF